MFCQWNTHEVNLYENINYFWLTNKKIREAIDGTDGKEWREMVCNNTIEEIVVHHLPSFARPVMVGMVGMAGMPGIRVSLRDISSESDAERH